MSPLLLRLLRKILLILTITTKFIPVRWLRIVRISFLSQRVLFVDPILMRVLLHQYFILFIYETLELALLEVADEYLLLLLVVHLTKLPELILLENTKRTQVWCPLSSQVFHLLVELSLRSQVIFNIVQPTILVSLTSLTDRNESTHASSSARSRSTNRDTCCSWFILEVTTTSVTRSFVKNTS